MRANRSIPHNQEEEANDLKKGSYYCSNIVVQVWKGERPG
jgi:hypothetical protein